MPDCGRQRNRLRGWPTAFRKGRTNRMQHIGRYFSESEYQLANRHNAIRWFICMGVGIPGIVVLAALLGFYLALFISIGAFPGIYFFVTNLFPGSKKHGPVLYKRYKTGRKIASQEFEKSKS